MVPRSNAATAPDSSCAADTARIDEQNSRSLAAAIRERCRIERHLAPLERQFEYRTQCRHHAADGSSAKAR
jgi:hypothetical protein